MLPTAIFPPLPYNAAMGLFGKRKMSGGMVFGPPGWMPERIEETFDPSSPATPAGEPKETPALATASARPVLTDRHSLLELLATMRLTRTSAIIPGIAQQMETLGGRAARALVLVLLPTQPEFILGPALSRLAMIEMQAGLEALQKALRPHATLIVLDRHDAATRRAWKEPAAALGARRVPHVNRYPKAHPTVLTRRLFGENLAPAAMPTERDLVYVDPVSCWALGRYVRAGTPFSDRPIQLFAEDASPRLVMGRIGEPLAALLKRLKIPHDETPGTQTQLIINGMLTGRDGSLHEPIAGVTESISLRKPVGNEEPVPCIACGWCVDVCPTALTPVHLMELSQKPSAALARSREAQEARNCIACGLCSYVCPTRLPLMEQIVTLKGRVAGGR
jgi:Na+-translocating ferredoxin:NAD+ oxidoreductase RnfC subunit